MHINLLRFQFIIPLIYKIIYQISDVQVGHYGIQVLITLYLQSINYKKVLTGL